MRQSSLRRALICFAKVSIALVVFTAGLNSQIHAQDATTAKVDDYLKTEMQRQRIPGASLVVVKDGQIILAKGYGWSNVDLQVAAKP
jgi:CubicO group peptidase (beta-lactamase class C family)